jgi:protein-tyrosine phosphatase
MAEGIAKAFFKPDHRVTVKSAGVAAIPGNFPSENAIFVCKTHGINIKDHRARPVSPSLLSESDAIFCMENYQCQEVRTLLKQEGLIRLIGKDVPGISSEIPDPYGKGPEAYERTFRDLNKAIMFHFGKNAKRREYDGKKETSR